MPERQHAGLLAGHVAGAEDGVGVAIQQRAQQARVFGGVVLQVGILDQREIAGGLADGGAHGGAFAAVAFVPVEADLREAGGQALQDVEGAVGGAVVHNHQFPLHVFRQGSGQHQRNAALHNSALVVDRHENRTASWIYRV